MPRPPAVPHADLQAAIVGADVVNELGAVQGPSHAVWKELAARFQSKVTPNYIYVYVKENRHGVLEKVLEKMCIDPRDIDQDDSSSHDESTDTSEDKDTGSDTDEITKVVLRPTTDFNVLISSKLWNEIKPVKRIYQRKDRPSDRVRMVLPGFIWEPALIKCLWDQHKIPCPYTFTPGGYVYVSANRDQYIKIEATCRECGAGARGVILTEPQEGEPVPLLWRAPDTRQVFHKLKRSLSGQAREDAGRELQGKSASTYRKLEAAKIMSQGDVEPPDLPRNATLRKVKQRYREKQLRLPSVADPLESLRKMKHTEPYAGSIHQIASDPFIVHYHSPAQLHVYRDFSQSSYTVLCIDATGSLVVRLLTPTGRSPHIFLYEGVFRAGDVVLPAFQMLSARQDTSGIVFWMSEFLRQGAPIPDEVVIDNSAALKSASAIQICGCKSLNDYYNQCLLYLCGSQKSLPRCYLRLDIAHFIGGACKWKEWSQKSTKRLKSFFVRCLALLALEISVEGFRATYLRICLVACSPCNGELEQSPVVDAVRHLSDRIEGLPATPGLEELEEPDAEIADDVPESEEEDENKDECENIKSFIRTLKEEVKDQVGGNDKGSPNGFYAPELKKRFEYLLLDFLMWTAIMAKPFGSPTLTGSSALVEGAFAQLKEGVLNGLSQPLRIDKFVATHLQAIEGSCRIAGAQAEKHQRQEAPVLASSGQSDDDSLEVNLSHKENWRNMAEKSNKKPSKYLNPCPELTVSMQADSLAPPANRLLLNGLKLGFIKVPGGADVELRNTCSFDALAQILTSAFIQYRSYREEVININNDLIQICKSLAEKGAVRETYVLRCEALGKVFDPVVRPSALCKTRSMDSTALDLTYDCEQCPIDMARHMLKGIHSAVVTRRCSKRGRKKDTCNQNLKFEVILPDMAAFAENGIGQLPRAILVGLGVIQPSEELPTSKVIAKVACVEPCEAPATVQCTFGPHLVVSADFFSATEQYPTFVRNIALEDIPSDLTLCGERFLLVGSLAREQLHFVAFTRRSSGTWEVYNDLARTVKNAKRSRAVCPVLLVYIRWPL